MMLFHKKAVMQHFQKVTTIRIFQCMNLKIKIKQLA